MGKVEEDEKRLRAVEDAIIYFKSFAQTVVVDLKDRVKVLESSAEEDKKQLYLSCDVKSKEIDTKIKLAKDDIYETYREDRKSLVNMNIASFSLSGAMFLLFISAVVYFNSQDGYLHNRINKHTKETATKEATNSTGLSSLLMEVKYIRQKIDANIHTHNKRGN